MEWTQLISSLGFPIMCCIFLFKQNIDIMNKHDLEVKSMTESLNNNTLAITRLCERMEERGFAEIREDSTNG